MTDTCYRIKPHYSIIGHDADKVEIRYGVWNPMSFYLNDSAKNGILLPFLLALDGKQSIKDIVKQLNISRSKAEAVLDQLRNAEIIENKPSSAIDFYLEKFSPLLNVSKGEASDALRNVILLGDADIVNSTSQLLNEITEEKNIKIVIEKTDLSLLFPPENDEMYFNGLQLERITEQFSHWKESFIVVLMSTLDLVALNQINKITREMNVPWLLGTLDGPFVLIGPTFLPGQGPCFACFEARVGMNIRETARYVDYKKKLFSGNPTKQSMTPMIKVLSSVLCGHAALEAANFMLTGNSYTLNKVLSIYLPTMEIAYNEVLQFSGCSVCGEHIRRDDHQLYFDMEEMFESSSNEN